MPFLHGGSDPLLITQFLPLDEQQPFIPAETKTTRDMNKIPPFNRSRHEGRKNWSKTIEKYFCVQYHK
jgi:hypothetical protein